MESVPYDCTYADGSSVEWRPKLIVWKLESHQENESE